MSQQFGGFYCFFCQFCLTIIRCTFLSFSVLFSTLNIYLWIHKNWVLLLDEANCVSLSVHLLNGFDLLIGFHQIRDITTNPEWERAYQYEIPVLARVRLDGTEVSHFELSILSICKFVLPP